MEPNEVFVVDVDSDVRGGEALLVLEYQSTVKMCKYCFRIMVCVDRCSAVWCVIITLSAMSAS